MFSLNGSPRSITICLEAMLDVKPHNALRTPFPEAGKCILDSSLRYSCAKMRRQSEMDLKYFFGFRFFYRRKFFLKAETRSEKSGNPLSGGTITGYDIIYSTMCVCVCVCVIISLCSWIIFVYVDAVYWFYGCSLFRLNWMFQHDCLNTYCF